MSINKKSIFFEIILIITVVFCFYFHTLNRLWIFYDERALTQESFVPTPSSISEAIEVITSFGINNNFSSTNYLYSSNSVSRANLLGVPLLLLLSFLFKNNAIFYHSFNLFFHLLNTVLVYLILQKTLDKNSIVCSLIRITLTLLWALHPTHVESILLSTNIGATLSYLVFFVLFYDFLKNKERNISLTRKIILPFCFLVPMLLNEYIIALPIILIFYSLTEDLKESSFKTAAKNTFNVTLPYLIGLILYSVYYLSSGYQFFQSANFNPLILTIERIFWLSPQIFMHYLKLVLFPITLSIDQTALVKLGDSLFDFYSLFCISFLLLWILIPAYLFLKKRACYSIFLTTGLFFISLTPFSQILSPTYCLCAERYFYTPVFFIVFGLAVFSKQLLSSSSMFKKIGVLCICIIFLLFFSTKTYIRSTEWKDDFTLINSTLKTSPNSLYKGFRLQTFAEIISQSNPGNYNPDISYIEAQKYFFEALNYYKDKITSKTAQPLILKSYGLDYISLAIKSVYLICSKAFTTQTEDYKTYLTFFKPYLKYIDSFDPRTLELYANLLIKTNQINESKKIFLYAYKKFPTSPFIIVSLIRFERDIEHNLIETKKYLDRGIKLYPYSKDILFESLRYYQAENNLPEYAKHAYLYGLRAHSKFTYHEALTGYLALEDLGNAKRTIDKLLEIDLKDPRTLYLASSYYIKKQNYAQAISLLNQAYLNIKENSTDLQLAFDIAYTLANLYLAQGDIDKSKIFSSKALELANNNSQNLSKIKNFIEKNKN